MTMRRRHRFWVLCAATTITGAFGCQRRAPGPEECHELAVRWLSTEAPALTSRQLSNEALAVVEDAVLELTTECLTKPYDRELVRCVVDGGTPRTCLSAFEKRHDRGPEETP
jgi:hypothetical protein